MDRTFLALAGALVLSGCAVELPGTGVGAGDDDDGSSATGTSSGAAEGKLTLNGLALDMSALALLDPSALGHWASETEAIADSGSLDALLAHPAGAEHIEYLALCALDEGQTLSAGGVSYQGTYGLATQWVDSTCDESCQRWISACVLAHANKYGISVMISLRGAHRGLVWDQTIAQQYTLQEAAFYGNVFEVGGYDSPEQPVYSCAGRALIAFDEDPDHQESSLDYLQKRICGAGSTCGLTHKGPCVFPDIMEASTCSQDAGWDAYYGNCEGENSYQDPELVPVYPEVITTYLVEE
jgi:hypothetical protein